MKKLVPPREFESLLHLVEQSAKSILIAEKFEGARSVAHVSPFTRRILCRISLLQQGGVFVALGACVCNSMHGVRP